MNSRRAQLRWLLANWCARGLRTDVRGRLLVPSDQRGRFASGDGEPLDGHGALDGACADLPTQLTEPGPGGGDPLSPKLTVSSSRNMLPPAGIV